MWWIVIGNWKNDISGGFKWKSNNDRNSNFIKKIINCWYDEWLLVNKNVILIVDLDENQ